MTHRELCELGAKFLKTSYNSRYKFQYIVVEFANTCGECPDVFGLKGWTSILIEVKVSRSDFLADFKKPHREIGKGIGAIRYFLCPEGLIKENEVPDSWGLMYAVDGKIEVMKRSADFPERNFIGEQNLMYSIIRRTNKKGILNFRNTN